MVFDLRQKIGAGKIRLTVYPEKGEARGKM